jgi:hypothetical protein
MTTAAALAFPRLHARVTSLSGPRDTPAQRTSLTCNNAIQIAIYSCHM